MSEYVLVTEDFQVISDEGDSDIIIFSPNSESVTVSPPSDGGSASAIGDPHVMTFDGVKYTL